MEPKRVLHVIPAYGGGISTLVRNIILHCDKTRIINDVVGFSSYPTSFLEEIKRQDAHAYVLPRVHKGTILESIAAYGRLWKDNTYDAVHLHLRGNQFIYFAILSRFFGCRRIIVHAHIANDEKTKLRSYRLKMEFWRFITVRMADQMASCSMKASAFVYGDRFAGSDQIMHIPNGVDIVPYELAERKDRSELRRERNLPEDMLIIGHVGYLGYQKNHPFMIEIADELARRGIDFRMLFIGTGWAEADLQGQCRDRNLEEKIVFLGRRNDIPELFRCMDTAILPSLYEGLPTVAVEAQAAGIPQLISDTVTEEVDLGLGLIEYLPLEKGAGYWADKILETRNIRIPPWTVRRERMEKRYFTADSAAMLYTKFIYGEIDAYNLTV